MFRCYLSTDIVAIIKGTNIEEAREYVLTFITLKEKITLLLFIMIVVIASYYTIIKEHKLLNKYTLSIPITALIVSILALIRNNGIFKTEFISTDKWIFKTEEVIDLRQHKTNPIVNETDTVHPNTIIILLGESFSKSHSSLYGYEKLTNPLISKYVSDSTMAVFSNVKSPAPNTTKAFKFILNDYTLDDEKNGKKWYEGTTLIEALQKAGYYSTWISNQSQHGMYDNLPSGHANICDESYFNPADLTEDEKRYDGYMLSVNTENIRKRNPRNLFLYHFMGQHESFNRRFPSSFSKFKPSDYKDAKDFQRQNLADYDNATLYNDYVVNEIIKKYSKDDVVIFYFSDHALDVYETSDDYCGHARFGNQKSIDCCLDIPFMVYVSESLDRRNPAIKRKLYEIKDKEFSTENLTRLVLDLAGWKIK